MNRETRRRLEEYRRDEAGPIENNVIDELARGEIDRKEFIRRGTLLGLSMSAIGTALAALGEAPLAFARPAAPAVGGRLRMAIIPPPSKDIEPHTFQDQGSLETGSIAGEFLTRSNSDLTLSPELATKWTPNADGTVWTFSLRPGVKFQNGETLKADDVVTTYNRLVDPKGGSQALSAFQGVLSPGGITKVDDLTVRFKLDGPTASFPYLTSSTTYQAIVLPASYKLGTFTSTPQATGAFKLVSFTPGVGAKYDRYDGWWGGHAALDGVDVTYFSEDAAVVSALLGGSVDLIGQIQFATARALFNNANAQIISARGSTHRSVPMRVDQSPLDDFRVRQAIALTLDRPAIVKTLFNNLADIGNDSPFAPVFPSTDKSLAQRHKDLATAKQLMEAAGHTKGFSIELTTEQVGEIPQLAQIIQRSVKEIGIKMKLKILTSTAYFAGTQSGPPAGHGTTPWLNAPITITDWGHRAVPNVLLTAALKTGGQWNASHYSNKRYDAVLKSYIGAIALSDQRKYAGQIERLLQHDTPIIYPYFYNYLAAGSKKVKGYLADAQGGVYLSKTSLLA